MADITQTIPHILKWEGNYINHKNDKGGATNMGITLATWKACGYDKDGDGDIDTDDIKILTVADFETVFKKYYWDRWQADKINNQSIANILTDWVYNSGSWGVRIPQQIMGIESDGKVGPITIATVNRYNPKVLFDKIWAARYRYYHSLVNNDESQEVFLKGWINRLTDIKFMG